MHAERELSRVRGEGGDDPVPPGFELDELTFAGGPEAFDRARELMTAVLTGQPLPGWFVEQCVDDSTSQTCNLDRWSLRAWKFWLAPENRRWWWWAAEPAEGQIRFTALVERSPTCGDPSTGSGRPRFFLSHPSPLCGEGCHW